MTEKLWEIAARLADLCKESKTSDEMRNPMETPQRAEIAEAEEN